MAALPWRRVVLLRCMHVGLGRVTSRLPGVSTHSFNVLFRAALRRRSVDLLTAGKQSRSGLFTQLQIHRVDSSQPHNAIHFLDSRFQIACSLTRNMIIQASIMYKR